MPNKLTQAEFIERATKVHNGKYSYEKTVYNGSFKYVTITCPIHGDFQQKAYYHLLGVGCKSCTYLKDKANSVDGICDVRNTKRNRRAYDLWYGMLERCKKLHAYRDCSVCEEWKTFSNFKKWHDENYIKGYALDKDLFSNGEKVYSPNTCCYIPARLNSMLSFSKKSMNGLPVGVRLLDTKSIKYTSSVLIDGKMSYLGTFDTKEEAFRAYKIKKEEVVKSEAESLYADNLITKRVYDRLMKFEVKCDIL